MHMHMSDNWRFLVFGGEELLNVYLCIVDFQKIV